MLATDNTLHLLLDALEDGIILIDEGRVVAVNRAAVSFLDLRDEQAWNLPLIAVLRDHRLERVYLEGGDIELEAYGRVLHARAIPAGLVLRDLTSQRRAEENARKLLAVLSHELRTPVTTIRATFEALRYDLSDTQRQRFLERAENETERLVRLLDDLTVDVKPPSLRRIVLSEVVERAVVLLQDTFAEHGLEVVLELPPFTVLADTDKLLQVLINLLENAAIHGPDNKTVYVQAQLNPENPQQVCVNVRDQGEPLAGETIARLFEPHTRGKPGRAKGTGLGLYIVQSIAQRWGGQAWGEALADGNVFGFSVPLP